MTDEADDAVLRFVLNRPCFAPLRKLAALMGSPVVQPPAAGVPRHNQVTMPGAGGGTPAVQPLPSLLPNKPVTSGIKATPMPAMPGGNGMNVIEQMGGLDHRGQAVNGNFAAGTPNLMSTKVSSLLARFLSTKSAAGFVPRGWQWKALQKTEAEGAEQWVPRIVRDEHTPLTELLASPGKQGLLYGLLGGGLAGGGAALASHLSGAPINPGVAAAAVGVPAGLLSGAMGYSHRVRKNDEILDALRRTPPGAVIRDWENLKDADTQKIAAENPLGSGPAPSPNPLLPTPATAPPTPLVRVSFSGRERGRPPAPEPEPLRPTPPPPMHGMASPSARQGPNFVGPQPGPSAAAVAAARPITEGDGGPRFDPAMGAQRNVSPADAQAWIDRNGGQEAVTNMMGRYWSSGRYSVNDDNEIQWPGEFQNEDRKSVV